jgi:pimeloyl-ACP methyl ester carboxylesterase
MAEPTPIAVALPGPPPFTMSAIDEGSCRASGGSQPTLLCLHGVGGTKEQWLPQIKHFAQRYRIVAPDLRGHGGTPAVARSYALPCILDDVQQLIAARQIQPPIALLAHSYGGVPALQLALEAPALISHVVLIGVAAEFNYGLLFRLATRAPVPGGLLELGRRLLFKRRFRATAPVMRALMAQALLPWRGWEQLHEVRQPVLAIAGMLDVVAPPQAVARMVRQLPNGQLRVVARVKHKIQLQRPNKTNQIIERFLAGASV